MDWRLCEEKFMRVVEVDRDKIESLLETTGKRYKFLKTLEATEENVSFIVENTYELIKELLVALLLTKGLRSQNHQCLISYVYTNYKEHEAEARLIADMSYRRNRLNYYGELIEFAFHEKNKEEFEKIMKLLREIISKELRTTALKK